MIENSYNNFQKHFHTITDLESLDKLHMEFLESITQRALLTNKVNLNIHNFKASFRDEFYTHELSPF